MCSFRCSLVALAFLTVLRFTAGNAADIAIVDFADQWTNTDALVQTLEEFGIEYDDLTLDLEIGDLPLTDQRLLFIGSMTTNNSILHENLDLNAQVIQDFVKGGGIVIEPTQADQNESFVDWLPGELVCVRSDLDSPEFIIVKPDHPLFNAPNQMREADFEGWGHQGWPTVWEAIGTQRGFDVLAESGGRTAIMEASFGKGKFVMMALAPDKYHVVGNDDHTQMKAGLFMENILETYLPKIEPAEKLFFRGDSNTDGDVNLSDAVYTLLALFRGGTQPVCADAADADDDGLVSLTDAVYTLSHLFRGGDALPPPGPPTCGPDPTEDVLKCDSYPGCEVRAG